MITYKGRQIPETLEEIIDPKHTALIIHELLNDFCAKGGGLDKTGTRIDTSKILPPIQKLLETARKKNVKVMYVRATNHADNSTTPGGCEFKRRFNFDSFSVLIVPI